MLDLEMKHTFCSEICITTVAQCLVGLIKVLKIHHGESLTVELIKP